MFIDFLNAHWSYCEQCPLFSSVHNDSSGQKLLAISSKVYPTFEIET